MCRLDPRTGHRTKHGKRSEVVLGLAAGKNPGSVTADASDGIGGRFASSRIVSGDGSRVPLRGTRMTRRMAATSQAPEYVPKLVPARETIPLPGVSQDLLFPAHPGSTMAHILVIGASQGIGLETVKAALAAGHRVRAFARSAGRIELSDPDLKDCCADTLLFHRQLRNLILRKPGIPPSRINPPGPF